VAHWLHLLFTLVQNRICCKEFEQFDCCKHSNSDGEAATYLRLQKMNYASFKIADLYIIEDSIYMYQPENITTSNSVS